MTIEGLSVSELEDRYENYAMLSRMFREELDVALVQDLCDSPQAPATGNELFDSAYGEIRAYLDDVEDVKKTKSTLAIDYCLVFIGYGTDPNAKDEDSSMRAAYPYESVYTSGSKTLTSGLAEGVTLLYREQGFRPQKPRILADDHIACELEFMQFLVGREIAILRDGEEGSVEELRAVEKAFVEEHPLKWIESLGAAIGKLAGTPFYTALAQMTRGWLQEDIAYLNAEEVRA